MESLITPSFLYKSLPGGDNHELMPSAKPSLQSGDLFDLVRQNSTFSSSQVSTYDSSSPRAEEEGTKSNLFEGISVSSSSEEMDTPDEKMTLKEIISKRYHLKKSKQRIETKVSEISHTQSKRKLDRKLIENEEIIAKKEKLNNGQVMTFGKPVENLYPVPTIVLKDGKAHLETKFDLPLEVQFNTFAVVPEKKKFTTSNSFRNINHSEKWTEEETTRFYRALEIFGTDFTLITKLFPNRNRNQIKNKFLKEEKFSKLKVDRVFQNTNNSKLKKLFSKATKALGLLENGQTLQPDFSKFQETRLVPINKLRSESFHSTSSIDSLDLSIIEDLSDMMKRPPTNQ